jgi:hypothetical protein
VGHINGCHKIIGNTVRPLLRRSGHSKEICGIDRTPFRPRAVLVFISLKRLDFGRVSFKLHTRSHQARPCCRVAEIRSPCQCLISK